MDGTQDDDMYLFQSGFAETPAAFPGQAFDDFLSSSGKTPAAASPAFLNPSELSIKRESQEEQTIRLDSMAARTARSPPSSDGSTHSSSSDDATVNHDRNISANSGIAPAATQLGEQSLWNTSGISGLSMPSGDEMFLDAGMNGTDNDFEASNEQMASDFDFETAASTPSGFDAASLQHSKSAPGMQAFRRTNFNAMSQNTGPSPRLPTGQPQFYFVASREASPLSAMLPTTQGQSPWSKNSPSSGLEETFNGITMNGDSPNHPTFHPAQFSTNGFSFEPESSATPSTFNKDISSPPSTINSIDGNPRLTVQPTSLKSRVETQIPIKMTLSYLPNGATKLRLPTHTVSKPKFLAKPEVERNPEILELHVSLVCTSAMQDSVRLDRAFARARGEELSPLGRPSPASSNGSQSSVEDEDKPLNGGEVRICSGCIQRERKRASRKKQKKPEEEEQFQKDEEKRIVVFNTNELKEWVEPSRDAATGSASPPPGAVQVELPMRIACYCRHQNEKLGFQVIFTIKDFRDKVVAQAMTNSIMITDDHKTHNAPLPQQQMPVALPNAPTLPGAGVFASGMDMSGNPLENGRFKTSFSTTDLHGLQPNFNPNYPMTPASNPFAMPTAISNNTSATLTPRNLSRPVSPSGPSGPISKRRKQSGSGKIPSGLTMTRLETGTASGSNTMPNSAVTTPYPTSMQSYNGLPEHGYTFPGQSLPRPQTFDTSPPTPNSNDNGFMSGVNGSFSLENIARPALISAPSSRQPSRPGSPGPASGRNSFGATDPNFGQSVATQLMQQPSRRPPPLIHKLVPAEGSVTGGTEVTLLGNGFYQGLEVMFGDTEATTTTFWGEKCLNCIAPPALQPGTVTVMFKHEHHQYMQMQQQSQPRPSVFTYVDDREVEMYRLALKTLGKTMQHPTDDPYSAAQQLLGTQHGNQPWYWSTQQGNYGGHQRQLAGTEPEATDLLDLESNMLHMLHFMDTTRGSKSSLLDMSRPTGSTLLHLASSLGLTRFVAGLLAKGAKPDLVDRGGNTPMHHAAMNGHTHIIHRLRLAGADNYIRSIRNFIPADLATSLLAHQAAMVPSQHYRSRSAGGTPLRLHSRNTSSTSLKSFWENASMTTTYSDDSDSIDSGERDTVTAHVGFSGQTETAKSLRPSRRPSSVLQREAMGDRPEIDVKDKPVTPVAYMMAWRNSLAAQINQFQESAQWTMPNLSTLPALPPIPDYQDYSMVRRVSSLFPQRPTSSPGSGSVGKEGWWETLTGSPSPVSSAPPRYDELYPHKEEADEDYSVKKRGAVLAAAEAAADLHLSQQDIVAGPSTRVEPIRLYDGKVIKRVELKQDRKLFFFWLPVLIIILGLMLRSTIPDVWRILVQGCDGMQSHSQPADRIVEVI